MNFSKKEKILIIILIVMLITLSYFFINEMFIKKINTPKSFNLKSNESGVLTYQSENGKYFYEIKEINNPNGIKKSDNYVGVTKNESVKFQKYKITCYKLPENRAKPFIGNPYVPSQAVDALATYDSADVVMGPEDCTSILVLTQGSGGITSIYD
jgi:cell division protein FtsL